MRPGFVIQKTWDETSTANKLIVPFGHVWELLHAYVKYVADATVATRLPKLHVNTEGDAAPNITMLDMSLTASQTKTAIVGFNDDESISQHDYNQTNNTRGMWIFGGTGTKQGYFQLAVTSEQAGDVWDVFIMIRDHTFARA